MPMKTIYKRLLKWWLEVYRIIFCKTIMQIFNIFKGWKMILALISYSISSLKMIHFTTESWALMKCQTVSINSPFY